MATHSIPVNLVFLGDSLTEGIGFRRPNYVTALAGILNGVQGISAQYIALRRVPDDFNPFIHTTVAGRIMETDAGGRRHVTLWNLASEGTTMMDDPGWLSLIHALAPEVVFVHRGGYESVLRPACLMDKCFPWWLPGRWRGSASLDPRCYFSHDPLRAVKQRCEDMIKQKIRHRLLSTSGSPQPLLSAERIGEGMLLLQQGLEGTGVRLVHLPLLGICDHRFPGSGVQFNKVNQIMAGLLKGPDLPPDCWALPCHEDRTSCRDRFFCRDGFHYTEEAEHHLAGRLAAWLVEQNFFQSGGVMP